MGKFKNIWNRSKDSVNREERSFVRYAIVVTLLAVLFITVKHDNAIRWIGKLVEIRQQEKRIEFLQDDNQRLKKELNTLTTDKDSLEKFAREKFLFSEPGEDVYVEE